MASVLLIFVVFVSVQVINNILILIIIINPAPLKLQPYGAIQMSILLLLLLLLIELLYLISVL